MTHVGSEKTFKQSELNQSAPAIAQDFNQQSIANKTMFLKKPKGDKIAWYYRQCVEHYCRKPDRFTFQGWYP